jgi:metal-responsive CopG/Arc/MetJ family transcriptional regulator
MEVVMARKVKLTLSLDENVVETLDFVSKQSKQPRSRVVQDAIQLWQRRRVQQELADGYRSMSKEDQETAELRLAAFREILE